MAKRKQSEAQLANLEKGKKTQFNGETAVRAAQKSQEKQKQYKAFKDIGKELLSDERKREMLEAMIAKAMEGDVRAFEVVRDTLGEKPKEEVEMQAGIKFGFESIEDWDDLSG